jgi:hypothetical protein
MHFLIGLDDTDRAGGARSTARLAREIAAEIAETTPVVGVVGHLLFPGVKATTNNKASCIVLMGLPSAREALFAQIAAEVARRAEAGSAPGLAMAGAAEAGGLVAFARDAAEQRVSLDAARWALKTHTYASFGAGRGLIGAAAAIGLTQAGWSGRWLEFGGLRGVERVVTVGDLLLAGMRVFSIETDADVPRPDDWVDTRDGLRPALAAGAAAVPLRRVGDGSWEVVGVKPQAGRKRAERPENGGNGNIFMFKV